MRERLDVVCLGFSVAFDMISPSILLEKLTAYGLEWCTPHWLKNCVRREWRWVGLH